MKRASIAALKARLSEFLEAVKAGEDVIVTDRGRPVARLSSIGSSGERDVRTARLIRAGLVRAPQGKLPRGFWDRPRPLDPEGRSLELLLAERDEGW